MDIEDSDHDQCIQELIDNSHEWTLEAVATIMDDQDKMVLVTLWEAHDIDRACEEEMLVHEERLLHHNFWIKD